MTIKLKRASCDPTCGFMIQSHNEQEIISVVKMHAQKAHSMKVSDSEVRAKIQNV